jgi:biopolymer transport protein ExbB/TolQ
MTNLYQLTVSLFYQLTNSFFWPVAVALLALLTITLIDLGGLFFTFWRKSGESRSDLPAIVRALAQSETVEGAPDEMVLSPSLRRFWTKVETRLRETGSGANVDLWLEEVLQQEEIVVAGRLDRTRLFVRIGPMLGLAGTIIPLEPALQALLGGDMAGMVNHLVVGFGAVVCGLVMSGVAYFITLVRERWTRVELKEMKNLCELVLRALGSSGRATGEDTYKSLRTA